MNHLKIATRLMLLIGVLAALLMAIGLTGLWGTLRAWSILAMVAGVGFAVLFGFSLIRGISRALQEALAVTHAVAQGYLCHPIHLDGQDEVAQVVETMDATRYATVIPAPTRQRRSSYQLLTYKGVPA